MEQKQQVRTGTLTADRAAELAEISDRRCLPWLAETPRIRQGHPSVFKLPRWLAIRQRPTTRHADLEQCMYADDPPRDEADTYKKGTAIIGNIDLVGLPRYCEHPDRDWYVPSSGRIVTAPHPPLCGRERAYLIGTGPCRKRPREQPGQAYLTRATAHYPAELTWQLIARLVVAARDTARQAAVPSPSLPSDVSVGDSGLGGPGGGSKVHNIRGLPPGPHSPYNSPDPPSLDTEAPLDHAGRPTVRMAAPLRGRPQSEIGRAHV